MSENLTLNLGLRVEWENGIKEDDNAMVTDFDPEAKLAISYLSEAAYARSPLAQLPASQFRVRGGPVYASASGQDGRSWRPQTMLMPRVSAAYKLGEKTVVKGGYGLFYDTLNATDYGANNLGYNSTTTVTNSTDFGQTFALGDPRNGVLGISDPFPIRNGERFDQPFEDALGVDAGAGSALNVNRITSTRGYSGGASGFSAKWPATCQSSSLTTGRTPTVAKSASGETLCLRQYWITGNVRNNAAQAALVANVTNPYRITNFEMLRTTNPVLYQRMATNAFFTSPTVQANRLLRPFSHFNTGDGLVYQNLPLGENKGRSVQILVNRRYANGFTANMALSFTRTRSNRTINEFDREPTLWLDDNSSRPYRLSGGAVYELPFGANRRWMSDGGVLAALAGGWQLAGTFERQPGSLIQFTTNCATTCESQLKEDDRKLRSTSTADRSNSMFNIEV